MMARLPDEGTNEMQGDMVGTIMAGRLEFRALMERGARMMDPEAEPMIYGNHRQAEAEAEAPAAAAIEAPAAVAAEAEAPAAAAIEAEAAPVWAPDLQAVEAPALQLARRNRAKLTRRAQPLAPLAPLALGSDAF
jgi:hypothetical protein